MLTTAQKILLLGGSWSPKRLFASGEQGVWYDPSDLSSMFQDSAGTTAAAVGQPVGLIQDKSGRGNHASQATPTSRPTLQSGYASFDGVDDSWATGSVNFSGTDKVTVIAGVYKASDAAAGIVAELSVNSEINNGAFGIAAPGSATKYIFISRGSLISTASTSSAAYNAPISNVVTCSGNISGDRATLSINGVQVANDTANQGAGNYSNAALYVGSRGGSSLPFNGRLYGLIIIGRALTTPEIAQAERWMAAKAWVSL